MIKVELTSELNKSANLDISASLRTLLDEATKFVQTQLDGEAHQRAVSFSGNGLDRRRLIRVLDYIETHLESDLNLGRMASVACLSRFHFSRKFKQAVGCSPLRYVAKRRFERAKALLSQGDRSLVEIALSFRFSSQANFTRAFKRATGLAPGQYRQQFRWQAPSTAKAVAW